MAVTTHLQKELAKAVHAYNEKIRYHAKNSPELSPVLPDRERARDIKKGLETKRDYQREINRLRSFGQADITKTTTIGTRDNITITKWEKQAIKKQVEVVNRQRAARMKKVQELETTAAGRATGKKRRDMPSFREADLAPKKLDFSKFATRKEFEMYKATLERQVSRDYFRERAELFKTNYIDALRSKYGKAVNPLIRELKKMDALKMEDTYYKEQDASIEYVYIDSDNENAKINTIYKIWGSEKTAPNVEAIEI